ncbi:hypothetical protein SAMN04488057_107210 [Cyclobacterium lianum]|uniref:Heparinase II/III-like protein n=1 Tax=Cyclobacterium lianum TaxID=388280 RepID=A0A1M7P9Z3_9BACT|nr:hypothetical protein [Cyclobacterium lianum]SHN13618.1 hypothetical protein SAMN04488057_107210 [Cyclobacterium lianum]
MKNKPYPNRVNASVLFCCILCVGLCVFRTSSAQAQDNSLDWLISTAKLEGKTATGIHPRGLILPDELPLIREKMQSEAYQVQLEEWMQRESDLSSEIQSLSSFDARKAAELAALQALLYVLTGQDSWAREALQQLEQVFEDKVIFDNPVARGLTKAAVLRSMAITYDFCYPAWEQQDRNLVNRQLYKTMYTTQASMGFEANYSLVSNWMGVRWGAVLFAALVWDNPDPDSRSIADPLIWDASKRLIDHLNENIYAQGWNAESIGYHIYNWSFIGPALIAFQNRQGRDYPVLDTFAPQAIHSLKAMASSMVNIPVRDGIKGVKPDLSDDNLNIGDGLLAMGLRLYPNAQLPAIKWMHDYLGEKSLYSVLYDRGNLKSENPENMDWLNHADTTQGLLVFRKSFEGPEDIVALFNVSQKRIAGHKGPDVNTFRIIGGGVPLAIGAGRTGLVAGQTNLFTKRPGESEKGDNSAGKLVDFAFEGQGSGHALGSGSSMGVEEHLRKFTVAYDEESGAEAVFLVEDYSVNGRIWRLNTPEFNQVTLLEDGFLIQTPTGFTLQTKVLHTAKPLSLAKTSIRYGGNTSRLNPGILWQGQAYSHSTAIDIPIAGNSKVLLVLQAPGRQQPRVISTETNVQVGSLEIPLFNPKLNENTVQP